MSLSEHKSHFSALLERNHVRWMGIARSYALPAERDDLLQEILMQIWKSLDGFAGNSSVDTWAYRVALNTAMTWNRNTRARSANLNTHSMDVGQLSGETVAESHEERVLDEFLNSLSKSDRAVMLLFLDAIPNAEAAEIMGMTDGALRVKLHRIRKQFEETWCATEKSNDI